MDSAPAPDADDRPADAPAWGLSLRQMRAWFGANRGKIEILLIGGVALGGIVCMMAITIVVLIVHLRR
jgi:hypothetical protein